MLPCGHSDSALQVDFYVDVFEDAEDTGQEQGHEVKVTILHRSSHNKKVKIEDLENLEEDETFLSQFTNALSVNGGESSDEATIMDCIMHYCALGWKVLSRLIPNRPCALLRHTAHTSRNLT